MDVAGKVVIVTGGGNGIGKAMCERFHRAGARKVVVADLEQVPFATDNLLPRYVKRLKE